MTIFLLGMMIGYALCLAVDFGIDHILGYDMEEEDG